ncbi:peptide chain release factor N(5)-glutamine methyltransferase [Sphingobacterium corticibacterium]|uniref:Release factor glutamine methyltransferase n=1 Tax=Sphingobacterium corticibacterium TaxID=2484746 RepID=A0A4Q6Y0B3_9SPHI|nr:peptide chain release factor N(5)-glutamine methyltransferase [Sphingobacterium corticibacterium]RZF62637.1 peptide chain release factor N(5)-glutamine methyltransferase [Sphingobacterium corticibacterium]
MKNFKDIAEIYREALLPLYSPAEIKQLFLMTYAFVMKKNSMHYMLNSTSEVKETVLPQFLNILEELQTGRPIQHILGKADFYGLCLSVNEHTLIPRPETEELVEWIVREHQNNEQMSILDIGTGSGCIALALKKQFPHAQVDAIDLQSPAITVARTNATNLNLSVNFIEADILEWDSFLQENQQYDIIVSNPPYITPSEQKDMHQNVLLYEPHSALFVEEQAPLLFYDVIAEMGKKHLSPGGSLYFEINQYLGRETYDLLLKKGYEQVTLRQDLNQVDRMIKASFKKLFS